MAKRSKIKVLNNAYFQQKKQESAANERQSRGTRFRMGLLAVIVVIVTFFCGIRIVQAEVETHQVNKQTAVAERKLQRARARNASLSQQVQQLSNNDYVQKVIRQRYNYTKKGETVYNLPQTNVSDNN